MQCGPMLPMSFLSLCSSEFIPNPILSYILNFTSKCFLSYLQLLFLLTLPFQILNSVHVNSSDIARYTVMACYYFTYFKLELKFFFLSLKWPIFLTLTHDWPYPQNSDLIIAPLFRVSFFIEILLSQRESPLFS